MSWVTARIELIFKGTHQLYLLDYSQIQQRHLRQKTRHSPKKGLPMYALIAIGVVVALFAILNLIDFRRLD